MDSGKLRCNQGLGEDVYKLIFAENKMNLKLFKVNSFSYKMKINNHMLGTIMKNGID